MKGKTQQNVPSLRFPEFSGEWEMKKGNDVFDPISDKNHKSDLPILAISQEHGAVPRDLIDYKISVTDKSVESYKIVKKGNFIISLRSFQGGIEYSNYNGICSPAYIILKSKIVIEDLFYKYHLKTEKYIKELNRKLEGIRDGKMISYNYFSDIQLPYPKIQEQQKIAHFLKIIDDRLQILQKQKDLLEQYKKGMMQRLFSQSLRFKDDTSTSLNAGNGNDFPDWEVKNLGEVCEKKSSNISANKIEDNIGEYIIYGASGVLKKIDFYEEENDYVSIIKDGAGVGRIVYCKGKSSVLGTMEIIKPKIELNTYFLYCLLENIDFTKYITGSTIPHIYFKDYKNEYCGIPCISEQIHIANFLSEIDGKIANVQAQVVALQQWKKGLIQRMFC
jgi:type I restriction enzyme S subunit